MYTLCKYDTSKVRIDIDFTKNGSRDFHRLNARHSLPMIPIVQLKSDLAEYIERHLDSGLDMAAEFDVRYDDGILLTVFLSGGTYYIREVTGIGETIAFKAILIWQRVKFGCDYLLCRVLTGWYFITDSEPAISC